LSDIHSSFFFSLSKWLEVALLKLCSHLEEYDEGNGMYWQQAAPLWVQVIWGLDNCQTGSGTCITLAENDGWRGAQHDGRAALRRDILTLQ